MKMIDPSHRFYRPIYVRIGIVALCLGWAIIEATFGEPIWSMAIGAVGAYAAWVLLLNYTPTPEEIAPPPPPRDDAGPEA
ncbi:MULTISPECIES: hypothetical protein [unclassified Rhizobium]|uniref:hypothetical protein n=1 Tax=unclassified Rhizobium TaxID=2613769 RepID=UPI001AD961BF|nr:MULTISPECIES: hypothetical protein [unclassified Rhizobium]MBO9098423.1 hypothetical protein [Rhizobium sp. L58/93]MBO9132773.1 hypothetical protein [Rhizobium sp. B209b/85]MBO9168689.1 hypothetical protein [Rhizobium sp. L245/93]MBO9184639.1 hypothetical protein [Rhizobium sp. E27B/91]QXZ84819.1 hypothetical protein J5287_04575 [Rhizobium sp. K1/93]